MKIYTIGFSGKTAEQFFKLLESNDISLIVDTRLRPDGQLSAFARKGDLPYLLQRLISARYIHWPILSPTDDILSAYRKDKDWNRYVQRFEQLMDDRDIPNAIDRTLFERHAACLLCSEATPERCHRRLVAERMAMAWEGEIAHLT